MSKKSGLGKFVLGAAVGAGLGVLFAPKKGSETRTMLKAKLDELVEQVKNIDVDEVKKEFDLKVNEIRMELVDLDKEKALDIAKSQAKKIEKKANELYDIAKEKSAPVVEKAAKEVKETALKAAKEVVSRLETEEKKPATKKKTKVKKSI